ncbi:MAG: 30S ribosomal protein S3 [Candidatus Bathyarchaeia archaeon]
MSGIDHFISEAVKRAEINEYLSLRLRDAGYGGVDIVKTPLGVRITVQAMKPGLVIGRGGETIKGLSVELGEKFGLPNPQISVAEVPVPELNPYIVASQIAQAVQRGIHFRRAGFWALERVMKAGALGAEITIRGKLTSERSRHEKFTAGYLPKVGDAALKNLRTAVLNVQLKPGLWGIAVRILPPASVFPDRISIREIAPTEAAVVEAAGEGAAGEQPLGEKKAEALPEQAETTEAG